MRKNPSAPHACLEEKTGDVLLQLHLKPESKYRYSIPFGSDIPTYLQKSDNPYLQSMLYSTGSPSVGAQQHDGHHINDRQIPQYFKPYHAATILDPKLDSVKPSIWTTVSNDDKLMRSLLHDYFLHEYEGLPFFHKDHFLDDMLSGAKNFCSSLLVNSVLALSYHRSKFWDTQILGSRFLEEAKRLWELEKSVKPSLPTLQAALVMGNLLNMCSLDKIGRTYNVQALAMANELGLFKPLAQQASPRRRDSYTFTAWSLFFSNCVQDYHTLQPPLRENYPFEPLPDPVEDPAWYGSFWIVYPLADAPLLVQHGPLWKAKLELAMIMNDISIAFFGKEEAEVDKPTRLSLALMFTKRLTAWYSSLPVSLSPARIVFPSQFKLHFEGCDAYMTHFLAVLAFNALNRLESSASSLSTMETEDIRGTLILSAKGLNDQGQNYHLPRIVFHLLHSSMMAQDEAITSRITSVRLDDETDDDLRKEYVQAQYPINITNITESPEDKRLSNIIEKI
ncbi:nitrate assimilation regulatory nira [Fusarium sporotrichioides]|uniref:Nitrate assimilation regulatory nira n=1 Tax=Fusarium sporotrichioides TaxID=5514 RepID=A0A395RT01_FUSSP|nr:nitrate assimilation regulatory nira [Fusarium sporotrichioides]